jgi:phage-related protein (TIGR01555 family)
MSRRKPKPQPVARVRNAMSERPSGAGSDYDFGTDRRPSAFASPMQQDQFAVTLYETDWQAAKIISIPVDDMLRDGWIVEGLDEAQKDKIENAQERLGALAAFRQAKRQERLLGGAAIFLGVSDGAASPAEPLNTQGIGLGALRFINVIPRTRVQRVEWGVDPLKHDYGRPQYYQIGGERVHRSRLIIFGGDPIFSAADVALGQSAYARNDGFGQSKLAPIFDDLSRATGSRQAAFQLVERAGIFFAQMDLTDLQGTAEGEAKVAAVRSIINQINAYRGAVFDVGPGANGLSPVSTLTPNFGSVPELVMSFLQVLSAASDIPASRFLGQAPGGLNATGESDLENYFGRIEGERVQTLAPQIKQFLRVLVPSVLGSSVDADSIGVDFEPLWSLSAKEEAETRELDARTLVSLSDAGIITTDEAAAEAVERGVIHASEPVPADGIAEPDAPPVEDSLAALAALPEA